MDIIKNENVKKAVKIVTVAGASVLVVGSVMALLKVKSLKEGVMPVVAILVGVSAFGYAMSKKQTETTSNVSGNQIGKGFAKSGACNGPCPPGKVCSKGQCI